MNRLFFLGFLFTVIASVFWGAMGTAVQHLFQIKSGFFCLGFGDVETVVCRDAFCGDRYADHASEDVVNIQRSQVAFGDPNEWGAGIPGALLLFFSRFHTPMQVLPRYS